MTPRERVLAVLHGEKTDKVPLTMYESMIPQCAVERRLRNEGLCIVHRRVQPYRVETPNCVTETHTYTEDGKPRVATVTRTPVGEVSFISEPAGFTSWQIKKRFTKPEDYKVLQFIEQDKQVTPCYDEFAKAEAWQGDDVILRAGVGAFPLHMIMIAWMGVETFAVEWIENRDEILKLVDIMSDKLRQLFPILADAPITHANFGGNEVPEVMGIERYEEFCLPLMQECAELFHAKGKLVGSHMDGNNRPWKHLVAQSGMDYVEAFSPEPDTDMSLADGLAAWPDKALWINFPSSVHLRGVEGVKAMTRELLDANAGKNRLIIGITENIPLERWQENMIAISDVINGG